MNLLEKALRGTVLAGIFVLPFVCLIISTSLFFPYITGKNFAFRAIVEIIAALWLGLALVKPAYRPKRSWLLAAFAIFVFIIAIADAHGVAPFKSFWSNYERMDGWVTLAHLFVYFVVAASVMHTENLWKRLFQTSLAVSAYLSLYGFLQLVGIFALGQGGGGALERRVDATFGNPIYLSIYMLFHVFIAALLWVQAYEDRKKMLWPSIIYGAIIFFDTLALLFTETRGTIVGLLGAIAVSVVLALWSVRHNKTIQKTAVGLIAAVVVVCGGVWMARDTSFVHSVGFLQRMTTISTQDNTTHARFMNWGIAMKGFEERPLLGWGQENYAIVFDRYYDPNMYGQEPWFDRVHNIIFDWLIAGGILGLVSYLSLFVIATWFIMRGKTFKPLEKSVLVGMLAGYFIHNFFVFDNAISYILFATMLAYIVWRTGVATEAKDLVKKHLPEDLLPLATGAGVVLAGLLVWSINGAAYAQNTTLLSALEPDQTSIMNNYQSFQKAIAYGSFGTQEAREQLAQITAQLSQNKTMPTDQKQQWLNTAANELIKQSAMSPLDARAPFFAGDLMDSYGDYANAEVYLKKALALAPQKQLILFELAQNAEAQGNTDAMLGYYAAALNAAPANDDARARYAAAAVRVKNDTLADQLVAPFINGGGSVDTTLLKAYADRGQYAKITAVGDPYLKAHPDDIQGYVTMASIYYSVKDKEDTLSILKRAEDAIPSKKADIDGLIKQVEAGTAGN